MVQSHSSDPCYPRNPRLDQVPACHLTAAMLFMIAVISS